MPKVPSNPKPKLGKKVQGRTPKEYEAVWEGPCSSGPQGGITQSLLSRYLCCPERFRLYAVEGLRPAPQFAHRLEYGSMWHLCEESLAKDDDWVERLKKYVGRLAREYPLSGEQIEHWYHVCCTQFPEYVRYWAKHPDVKDRDPVLQEEVFHIPYKLSSGRVVYLRGRWDSVDVIGKGKRRALFLQENKTKGDVDQERIQQQLMWDLQTGVYLLALQSCIDSEDPDTSVGERPLFPLKRVAGVRYNVIRRPLSGGKHSIRRHKPTKSKPQGESKTEYYERLGGLIREEPEFFFMRWKVEFSPGDLKRFANECLNPVLENLCDDYEWWMSCRENDLDPFDYHTRNLLHGPHQPRHFRLPHGIYNPTLEGKQSDLDEYLASGNDVGLVRADDLFRELNDD